VVEGEDARGRVRVRHDLTARAQREPPLSAVARDTGFPPAIVVSMILAGTITERGVLPPERCVPAVELLAALARTGMRARRRVQRPR
jgi:lysine 6-dehydrogenase